LPGPTISILADLGNLVYVTRTQSRVVIAEDEALIRLDLKEMLEEEGFERIEFIGDVLPAVGSGVGTHVDVLDEDPERARALVDGGAAAGALSVTSRGRRGRPEPREARAARSVLG
jgi:hypothetical protein